MWSIVLFASAWADCPVLVSFSSLDEPLKRGDEAVASLDPGSLSHALEDARRVLPCLVAPPQPDAVAHYYGLVGIFAFVDGRTTEALEAFSVPRSLGGWSPPASISGPLLEAWESSVPGQGTRPLAARPEGWFAVDGMRAEVAPAQRPFLLQAVGADGRSTEGWLLGPRDSLPALAQVQTVAPAPVPAPVAPAPAPEPTGTVSAGGHVSRTLLVSGVAAGAAGLAAALVSNAFQQKYFDDPQQKYVTMNHALGYPAIGLLAVGGGLGASAVIVGRW